MLFMQAMMVSLDDGRVVDALKTVRPASIL